MLTNRDEGKFTPVGGASHGWAGLERRRFVIRCERCLRSCRHSGLSSSADGSKAVAGAQHEGTRRVSWQRAGGC
jgi:hypothetical protein